MATETTSAEPDVLRIKWRADEMGRPWATSVEFCCDDMSRWFNRCWELIDIPEHPPILGFAGIRDDDDEPEHEEDEEAGGEPERLPDAVRFCPFCRGHVTVDSDSATKVGATP